MRCSSSLFLFCVSRSRVFYSTRCHRLLSLSASNNSGDYETLTRHIHVGNLDWNIPSSEISQQLLQALNNSLECTTSSITVKPVNSNRARDRHKHHGGSAVLEFESSHQAAEALDVLKRYSKIHEYDYRLKYAVRRRVIPVKPPLTYEELERRKERAAKYSRKRMRIAETTDGILEKLQDNDSSLLLNSRGVPTLQAPALNWSQCPSDMDPMQGGGLKRDARGIRKRAAVEAFVSVLQAIFTTNNTTGTDNLKIADLACGSGNLALPLQWWLLNSNKNNKKNSYDMVAVDYNGISLNRLMDRSQRAGILVKAVQQDLRHLISSSPDNDQYAAIVSLHACGTASDMAMAVAVSRGIPFLISPCCIGKVNKWRKGRISNKGMLLEDFSYPRSQWLLQAVTTDEYELLAKSADYGVVYDTEVDIEERKRRQRCRMAKRIVEMDRLEWAREHGYQVRMMELPGIGPLYPKRELLLGAPRGSLAAERIMELPSVKDEE